MTLNEFSYVIKKIVDLGQTPCFECIECKNKFVIFEGSIDFIYNRRYPNGCCLICNKPFKIYGVNEEI